VTKDISLGIFLFCSPLSPPTFLFKTKDERKVSITLTEKGINLKERADNVPKSIMPVLLKDQDLKERVDELLLEIYRKNNKEN
jgi:hypothetical protein